MRVECVLATFLLLGACGPQALPEERPGGDLTVHARVENKGVPARELAFGPGGLVAMTWSDGRVVVRPVASIGRTSGDVGQHPGGATSVVFAPDGKSVATSGYDGVIRIWSLPGMRLKLTIQAGRGTLWSLAFSPDGKRIASGGEGKVVHVWSAADGTLLGRLQGHRLNIWKVRFSPDGRWLASSSFDRDIRLWDAKTGRLVRKLAGHREAVVGLDFSPDGGLLASSGDDSTVRIWRVADGTLLRTIDAGNHTYGVAFSPDGQMLATSGRARGAVGTFVHSVVGGIEPGDVAQLWRVSDGAALAGGRQAEDAMYVDFSPAGDLLATASEDGSVSFWALKP